MKHKQYIWLLPIIFLMGCGYQDNLESKSIVEDVRSTIESDSLEEITVTIESETEEMREEINMMEQFYTTEINDEIKKRIVGCSYPDTTKTLEISFEELTYVHVLHYDFQHEVQEGELICNCELAEDYIDIFTTLFENEYEIEKIRLVDEYGADDMESMADNNSSAFNYRVIFGTNQLSNHSLGRAIDINPLYNPYIFTRNGVEHVQPLNANEYVDRTKEFAHKIDHDDLCYQVFTEHGFTWGGDWKNSKDYQHFEKLTND